MRSKQNMWVIFDEADHHVPAPYFRLITTQGDMVALDDFRGSRNLVILFLHSTSCPHCMAALRAFRNRRQDYADQESTILAIFPDSVGTLEPGEISKGIDIPILWDADGALRQKYAGLMADDLVGRSDALLFILNAYGCPYAAYLAAELDDQEIHEQAIGWLEYIGVLCPE